MQTFQLNMAVKLIHSYVFEYVFFSFEVAKTANKSNQSAVLQ